MTFSKTDSVNENFLPFEHKPCLVIFKKLLSKTKPFFPSTPKHNFLSFFEIVLFKLFFSLFFSKIKMTNKIAFFAKPFFDPQLAKNIGHPYTLFVI